MEGLAHCGGTGVYKEQASKQQSSMASASAPDSRFQINLSSLKWTMFQDTWMS